MTVKIVINKNWKITYSGMRYCLGHDGVYVVYVSAVDYAVIPSVSTQVEQLF